MMGKTGTRTGTPYRRDAAVYPRYPLGVHTEKTQYSRALGSLQVRWGAPHLFQDEHHEPEQHDAQHDEVSRLLRRPSRRANADRADRRPLGAEAR